MTELVAEAASAQTVFAAKPDVERSASLKPVAEMLAVEVPVAVPSALADSVSEADAKWECHFLHLYRGKPLCLLRDADSVASAEYVLLCPKRFALFFAVLCRFGYPADKADGREESSLKASDKFVYPPP